MSKRGNGETCGGVKETSVATVRKPTLKALARKVLDRNREGNEQETKLRTVGNWNDLPDSSTAMEPFNHDAMAAIKAGQFVPVWSGVLGEWLYWVRGEKERKQLLTQGCKAPIYTLGELSVVAGFDVKALRRLHEFKREFDAVIHPPNAN